MPSSEDGAQRLLEDLLDVGHYQLDARLRGYARLRQEFLQLVGDRLDLALVDLAEKDDPGPFGADVLLRGLSRPVQLAAQIVVLLDHLDDAVEVLQVLGGGKEQAGEEGLEDLVGRGWRQAHVGDRRVAADIGVGLIRRSCCTCTVDFKGRLVFVGGFGYF